MKFSSSSIAAVIAGLSLLSGQTTAFSPAISGSSISTRNVAAVAGRQSSTRGCNCGACQSSSSSMTKLMALTSSNMEQLQLVKSSRRNGGVCAPGCNCPSCRGGGNVRRQSSMRLYADATETADEGVPDEVLAMDGVESKEEAHNVDRPERKSLQKKKRNPGKPLSEFEIGTMHKATVRSVASYGAFCDFGASSDGLLHISRMSMDFVSDPNEVVSVGDEIEVRLLEINTDKNQVALSLLTEEQEAEMKQNIENRKSSQSKRGGGGGRSADREETNALLAQIREKGFDSETWYTGTVASTPSFGAFVRVNAADIHEDLEGTFDGLVHISCLTDGRANFVEEHAKMNDTVKFRIKSIGQDGKVALTMTSLEYEQEQAERNAKYQAEKAEEMGDPNWKNSLADIEANEMPNFASNMIFNEKKYGKKTRGGGAALVMEE